MNFFKGDKELPGSFGMPLIGEGYSFITDPLEFCNQKKKSYGPIFKTKLLSEKAAFVVGYNELETILDHLDQDKHLGFNGSLVHTSLEGLYGKALPLYDWPEKGKYLRFWEDMLSSEMLEKNRLKELIQTQFLDDFFGSLQKKTHFSLYKEAKRWVTNLHLNLMFGSNKDLKEFQENTILHFRGILSAPINLPSMGGGYSKALEAKEKVLGMISKWTKEEQAHLKSNSNEEGFSSLLREYIRKNNQEKEPLSPAEIHQEFLWMSSSLIPKTVSSAIVSFCLLLMQKENQNTVEALRREFESHPDDLFSPLFNGCYHEALRLFPPFFSACRSVKKDFLIQIDKKEYKVEKGWLFWWSIRNVNRDSSAYPSPDNFDPSRWANSDFDYLKTHSQNTKPPPNNNNTSSSSSKTKKETEKVSINPREKTSQCPMHYSFGQGRNLCPGRAYSELLIKLFVKEWLMRFNPSLKANQNLTQKFLPVVRPVDSADVVVEPLKK